MINILLSVIISILLINPHMLCVCACVRVIYEWLYQKNGKSYGACFFGVVPKQTLKNPND